MDILGWDTKREYVMGGLDVEGLLDFGVWGDVEVDKDGEGEYDIT